MFEPLFRRGPGPASMRAPDTATARLAIPR
jgi:hypothetical protein